ncbi:MATE family efflux transporter [Clostridium sp. AF15-6B]|uniref:MATE family efflux transporter n=2 Tax=Lachnospiraceae TaxID=186803 RepID=A0A7G9FRC5_9FIRM|nr:MATE family efflux transporter [Lachnospiraceae bacterium]MBS6306670.1 MATE family efflux transporter [Clostridium sp.]QNM01107.1 MATE family efflux transporter [Wujia chipingensis]RGH01799.1 MATE family efflux transporter [Clostridium sp. AF16-25]RGH03934.1 MATE family efflux transporter [Clostridium sp. AF15-49]RGH07868.1 MATE family efflux transporter [Clostridium sp. AF15-6B]RHO76660.1 MATE family efflux transporter [Clostridium sp. AF43-10]RHQ68851.1 MATE family efflux transporter [C
MKKSSSPAKDLTVGSPMKLILGFAFPMFLGLLFQQFYSLVDTMIVGKYLGVDPFAGVGSTGSLNFIVIGFCMGLCSGFSVPISQSFGAKDFPLLRKMVTNSVWLCTFFSVVITTLMLLFCRPVLTWMNTPENIFEYAYIYIFIIFAGIPCTILYNMTAAILRALGDSKSPIIFLAISSAINIGLDLLLIIVFRMGVDGAALATVVSQGVSGVISIIYIKKKFDILAMEKGDWKLERHLAGKLTGVGIPMGLQYSITGIGSVILQTAVNGLGSIYVASMTAGSKINIFLACPFDALGQTMAPYAGQNIGARKLDRVGKGLRAACIIGFIVSGLMVIVVKLFGDQLTMLFLDEKDPVIMQNSTQFLIIVSAFYCLLTLVNTVRFTIQGMGFSSLAIIAGVMEMIARGIAGMLLVPAFGYLGACYSSPLAWLLADAFLIPAFFLCKRKVARQLEVGKA